MVIAIGSAAPAVSGVPGGEPHVLVFFKVTCSTTQIAAPAIERLAQGYPGRVAAVVQDPQSALDRFAREYDLSLPMVSDLDPYPASDAYGIVSAPTAVAVAADGTVLDVVESWDRGGWNRLSEAFAAALGVDPSAVSEPGDGLPAFKPG